MRLSLLEWILAAAAAVLLLVAGVQTWRAHHYAEKSDLLTAAAKSYADAQATNMATIATQARRLRDWQRACTPGKPQDDALAALRTELAQAKADLAKSKANREVIYARDPSARRWADAGLPSAVADQLFPDPDRPH